MRRLGAAVSPRGARGGAAEPATDFKREALSERGRAMGRSGGGGGGHSSGGFSGGGRSSGGFSGGKPSGGSRSSFGAGSGNRPPSGPPLSNRPPSGPLPSGDPHWHGRRRGRRKPPVVPVFVDASHNEYHYGGPSMPGGGAPSPGPEAFGRRRRRRWTILIVVALVVLLSGVLGLASSCAGTHIDGTPIVERQALPAGAVVETGYYTDEDGDWIHDAATFEEGLRAFYQKTGVQPYVYILPNGSTADLTAFAEEQYDRLFSDEGHFLLVFCDDGDGGFNCGYAMGSQATPVMDGAAIDVLAGNLDACYRNNSLSEEELFSKAFADTADTIMKRDDYATGSIVCIVIVLVPALIYAGVRIARSKREQRERDRELQEEILRTPLEKFGDQEVEELAKKYADDAPAAAAVPLETSGNQQVEGLAEEHEENISDRKTGD